MGWMTLKLQVWHAYIAEYQRQDYLYIFRYEFHRGEKEKVRLTDTRMDDIRKDTKKKLLGELE